MLAHIPTHVLQWWGVVHLVTLSLGEDKWRNAQEIRLHAGNQSYAIPSDMEMKNEILRPTAQNVLNGNIDSAYLQSL